MALTCGHIIPEFLSCDGSLLGVLGICIVVQLRESAGFLLDSTGGAEERSGFAELLDADDEQSPDEGCVVSSCLLARESVGGGRNGSTFSLFCGDGNGGNGLCGIGLMFCGGGWLGGVAM